MANKVKIMSEIKQVTDWIDAAQQKPSTRNVALYFGLCMEELIEGLDSIGVRDTFYGDTLHQMKNLCLEIKQGSFDDEFEDADKVELLDSACDMTWVALAWPTCWEMPKVRLMRFCARTTANLRAGFALSMKQEK
jgi:hypothetical protein